MIDLINSKRNYRIFLCILAVLAIPQLIYRFNHPELTETQLLLGFFKAYRELFQ